MINLSDGHCSHCKKKKVAKWWCHHCIGRELMGNSWFIRFRSHRCWLVESDRDLQSCESHGHKVKPKSQDMPNYFCLFCAIWIHTIFICSRCSNITSFGVSELVKHCHCLEILRWGYVCFFSFHSIIILEMAKPIILGLILPHNKHS